ADLSTAMLMAHFYQLWRVDKQAPADALRRAQIWLRDTTNGEKKAYYQQFLPEFAPDQQPMVGLPAAVADVFYKRMFALKRNDQHCFAHPLYWAAFQYIGV